MSPRYKMSASSPSDDDLGLCKLDTLSLSSCPSNDDLTKHRTHYYADGTFIFIVETTVFRIYKDLLSRRSEIMKDLFDVPVPSAESLDQLWMDGVPAVTLAGDDANDFANLLDIVMPGPIRPASQQTFDKVAGIYRLCDKYIIEDIRSWCISWIDTILPSKEEDLWKLRKQYCTDVKLVCRVIAFAQEFDGMAAYLPLALYALAIFPWTEEYDDFGAMWHTISAYDQYRVHAGRCSLQRYVADAILDEGCAIITGRKGCPHGAGQSCGRGKKHWDVVTADILQAPLEELDEMANHPPRTLCNRCSSAYVPAASLLRNEIFGRLEDVFLLK